MHYEQKIIILKHIIQSIITYIKVSSKTIIKQMNEQHEQKKN